MNALLFTYLYGLSSGPLGVAAIVVNDLTYVFFAVILLAAVILSARKVYTVSLLFLAGISTWLAATILKYAFNTARPPEALGITPLVSAPEASFPSAHAAIFAALAVAMFAVDRRAAVGLSILAALVGLSRVVLGVHYPADVLGGFAVGTIVALLYIQLYKKL